MAKVALPISGAGAGTFAQLATSTVPNPVPGGAPIQVTFRRGWVAAELRAGGRTIRAVNAHLEALSADVAGRQVSELLAIAPPASRPAIVLGDVNLAPGAPGYERLGAAPHGGAPAERERADPGRPVALRPPRSGRHLRRVAGDEPPPSPFAERRRRRRVRSRRVT